MKILALMADALREIYARKVVLGIVIVEAATLIITALVLFSDGWQGMYQDAASATEGARSRAEAADSVPMDAEDRALLGLDSAGFAELDTGGVTSPEAPTSDADSPLSSEDSLLPGAPADVREGVSRGDRGGSEVFGGTGPTASPRAGAPDPDVVLRDMVKGQLGMFAVPLVLAALFLGIFATAGIVPSMMEKGTIDLLLSKPISRTTILFGRTAGGIVAFAVNLLLFSAALFALYGFASGIWHWPFVGWMFANTLFTFLVLYSGIVALNVVTDGWVLPMSLAYVHMTILSALLTNRDATLFEMIDNTFVQALITALYWALPQVNDLMQATPTAIFSGTIIDWSPFLHGTAFMVVMLALAVYRFARKDF